MDFLTILLIILIILIISNSKKGGLFSKDWELKSERERQQEIKIANNNAKELLILAEEKNKSKNKFLSANNEFNLNNCNNRILGPVNEFHQNFKPLGKEYGFRHWWKKNKVRNYVPKDFNFDGTSFRQYLDNLDNVNNVYCS
tara:strand:- start:1913 stop:2338 length:426 start_codon:yes stop_codon:yes gene_type:complete